MTPSLLLPGDWTSPRLLVRILYTIGSEWDLTERGLVDRGSGDVCQLRMGPPDEGMAARLEADDDPVYPSLTPERIDGVRSHKSVVAVEPSEGLTGLAACRALLRCGDALIDAGAQAVWVSSGLAHGAERWQSLAEDLHDDEGLALFRAFVHPLVRAEGHWRTRGMPLLGHREVVVDGTVAEPYAYDVLDALGQRLAGGPGLVGGEMLQPGRTGPRLLVTRADDSLAVDDEGHSPAGVWRVALA